MHPSIFVRLLPAVCLAACAATTDGDRGDAHTTTPVDAVSVDVVTADHATVIDAATGIDAITVLDATAADLGTDVDLDAFIICPGFDVTPPSATACNPTTRWPVMDTVPIIPPFQAAGLDLRGASGMGLTLAAAEQINCASSGDGDEFGDGQGVVQWGMNGEVWFEVSSSTCLATQITMWPGYTGTATFSDAAHAHHYVAGVNTPITKDGVLYPLDWQTPTLAAQEFDELNRALMATFLPTAPQDPVGMTCIATHSCVQGNFGDVAYIYFPMLHLAFWVASVSQPAPETSIFNRIDLGATS